MENENVHALMAVFILISLSIRPDVLRFSECIISRALSFRVSFPLYRFSDPPSANSTGSTGSSPSSSSNIHPFGRWVRFHVITDGWDMCGICVGYVQDMCGICYQRPCIYWTRVILVHDKMSALAPHCSRFLTCKDSPAAPKIPHEHS